MEQIQIQTGIIKNMVTVYLPQSSNNDKAEAFLLGNTGEHRQKFFLHSGKNEIWLRNQKPGAYLLRIETGNEVAVKKIFITQ